MDRNAISFFCSFLLFLSIISLSSSARINPFIDSTVADNIIDDDHHNINDIIIDPHHSSSSIQLQSQQKSSSSSSSSNVVDVADDNSNIKPETATATATATLIQSEEEVPTVSLEKPTNNPLPRRPFTVFRIQPNNNNRRPFNLPLSYRRRRPVHRCHHHYNKPWNNNNNNNRRGVDITNMINNLLDDEFELLDNNINKDYFDRVLARRRRPRGSGSGGKISLIGHDHVNQPMFLRRHQPRSSSNSNSMAREKKSTDDLLLRRLYHRRYHQRPHQDAPSVLPDHHHQQIKDTTATAHGFVKSIRKFLNPF